MAEYWSVIYKAFADFGDVISEAAKARAALDALGKDVNTNVNVQLQGYAKVEAALKSLGKEITTNVDAQVKGLAKVAAEQAALAKVIDAASDAEKAGSLAAAAARGEDTVALGDQAKAYTQLGDAAKAANVWAEWGGRNSMAQHLSDEAQLLQYKTLLNRQDWLLFTSPQQAYAWRQQELQQRKLMNYATWADYTSPDQYLSFIQREISATASRNAAIYAQAAAYENLTGAARGYLTELAASSAQGEGGIAGIQALQAAAVGVPPEITTTLQVDDAGALAKLGVYASILRGIPTVETTILTEDEVLKAAYAMGGVPIPGALPPEEIPVTYDIKNFDVLGAELAELHAAHPEIPVTYDPDNFGVLLAELAALRAASVDVPVSFDLDPASLALLSHIPVKGDIVNISEHVTESGGVGSGAGPPVTPAEITSVEQLSQHLLELASQEADAAKAAYTAQTALNLLKVGEDTTGDSAGALSTKISAATDGLGALASTLITVGNGWFFLNSKIAVFGGLLGEVSLWHLALDALIEFLAVIIPVSVALLAGAAAFGIFLAVATQAGDTLGRVNDRAHALITASTALNQNIYPLTNSFDKLQGVIRPEVWELTGDAINVLSANTGVLGKIAEAVGGILDRFAAVIVADLPGIEHAIGAMVKTGAGDLSRLGVIFGNLGHALMSLVKVTQETHIAEYLLDFAEAATKLIAVIGDLPVPLLAIALGLHAIYLWGGLLVTGVVALLDPLRALALALGGVDFAESALGNLGKDATPLEKLKATISDVAQGFGALPGRIMGTQTALQQVSTATGTSVEKLALLQTKASETGVSLADMASELNISAADVAPFSRGLDAAGMDTMNLAAAAGASQAQLGRLAISLGGVSEEAQIASAGTVDLDVAMTDEAAASGAAAAATRGFGAALLSLLANPLTWVVAAAAAIALLAFEMVRAKDATQLWIQSMDSALDKTSVYQGIGQTVADLAAVTQQLADVQHGAAGNAYELSAAQSDLSGKLGDELTHVADISKAYGTNFVGALALLNAAQVTTAQLGSSSTKVWQEAQIQVSGLVTGYKAMAIGLGEVQNAVTIQLVANAATSPALGAMQKLNGYYDDFLTLSTALAGAFITTGQGAATFATDIHAAGASMTGLNAASLTAQTDAQTMLTNVEQQLDAFRNAVSVSGTGNITAYIKDMVDELIQSGPHTAAFLAQISQIADEGGYNGATGSLKDLTTWVGNIKDPMLAAQAATNKEVVSVSNLSADAALLSSTLVNDLNPAMANASFAAFGGQKAFSTFADDLVKFGPNSKVTVAAGKAVAEELLSIDKNSKTAKTQFTGWMEAMGMSKSAADKLWDSISKGEKPLADMRNGLAKSATSAGDLANSNVWAKMRDLTTTGLSQIGTFFAKTLPAAFVQIGEGFNQNVIQPLATFFTKLVPEWTADFVKYWQGVGTDIQSIWAHVWSALVAPVVQAFDDVKKAITTGFDGWWKTHGMEVEQVWQESINALVGLWDSFIADIELAWKTLVSWFSGSGGSIAGPFKTAINAVLGFFAPFFELIKAGFALLWAGAVAGFKAAWAIIEGVATATWDVISNAITAVVKTTADGLVLVFKVAWNLVVAVAKVAWDTIVAIIDVALDLMTGHWGKAWDDMKTYADQVWNALSEFVTSSWEDFITFLQQAWTNAWDFLKTTAEQVWNALYGAGKTAITNIWDFWDQEFIRPLTRFFTSTIPSLFDSFLGSAKSTWHSVWSWFSTDVVSPIGRFFSGLPNTIDRAFHSAVSTVVGYINDVLGFFHLPKVSFAAGGGIGDPNSGGGASSLLAMTGSVPGSGDSDSQIAAVMPGEYVLRKPARMALQQMFGHDFLPWMNYADQWLHAGSRGTAASQGAPGGMPAYQLGGIVGWLEHAGKDAASFLENPVKAVEGEFSKLANDGIAALDQGIVGEIMEAIAKEAETSIEGTAKKAASSGAFKGGVPGTSGDVRTWLLEAMADTDTPMSWLGDLEWLVSHESGGNPDAVDPIFVDGENATGLLQTLPSTYAEYATVPGGIRNPVSNAVAAIRYIKATYGSIFNIPGIGVVDNGYASGGSVIADWAAQLTKLKNQESSEVKSYKDLYSAVSGRRPSKAMWKEAQTLKSLQTDLTTSFSALMSGESPARFENFQKQIRDSYTDLNDTRKYLPLIGKAYPGKTASMQYWLGRLTNEEPLASSSWEAYKKTIAGLTSQISGDWHEIGVTQGTIHSDWEAWAHSKMLPKKDRNNALTISGHTLAEAFAKQQRGFTALSKAGASSRGSSATLPADDWTALMADDRDWSKLLGLGGAYAKNRSRDPARWEGTRRALDSQATYTSDAYGLWKELFKLGVPGPGTGPTGGGTPPIGGGGGITVDPGPAVNVTPAATMGGPTISVIDVAAGGADMGFSGGGTIRPFAAGGAVEGMLSPAEAVAMFGAGLGTAPPMMPAAPGGINSAAGVVANGSRVLSDAAAAARRVGVENMSIVVNNPSSQAAEPSIAHATNRAMFLAGRQVA